MTCDIESVHIPKRLTDLITTAQNAIIVLSTHHHRHHYIHHRRYHRCHGDHRHHRHRGHQHHHHHHYQRCLKYHNHRRLHKYHYPHHGHPKNHKHHHHNHATRFIFGEPRPRNASNKLYEPLKITWSRTWPNWTPKQGNIPATPARLAMSCDLMTSASSSSSSSSSPSSFILPSLIPGAPLSPVFRVFPLFSCFHHDRLFHCISKVLFRTSDSNLHWPASIIFSSILPGFPTSINVDMFLPMLMVFRPSGIWRLTQQHIKYDAM